MPSCGAVMLSVSTLRHVIQHVKMAQSPRVASAFPFKQLLHTPWSFRGRKKRLSKFTVAHWPTQEMWCKRFRRPGHMTRAGSVDGKGETGGERLEWCVSEARVVYSSMRHTKPSLFILYSSCEFLLQKLSVVFPHMSPCPALSLAAVVTVYSHYLDSWKLRERPEPLEFLLQHWSH